MLDCLPEDFAEPVPGGTAIKNAEGLYDERVESSYRLLSRKNMWTRPVMQVDGKVMQQKIGSVLQGVDYRG